MESNELINKKKYLKYKDKYIKLKLKQQIGRGISDGLIYIKYTGEPIPYKIIPDLIDILCNNETLKEYNIKFSTCEKTKPSSIISSIGSFIVDLFSSEDKKCYITRNYTRYEYIEPSATRKGGYYKFYYKLDPHSIELFITIKINIFHDGVYYIYYYNNENTLVGEITSIELINKNSTYV